MERVLVKIAQDAVPVGMSRIADIARASPRIAQPRCPGPCTLAAPIADVEKHRPAGVCNGIAHSRVELRGRESLGLVTKIFLDKVDTPQRKSARILFFVLVAAFIFRTGLWPQVGVDSSFQSFAVDVGNQGRNSIGELGGVGNQCSIRGTMAGGYDALLNDEIPVTNIPHPGRY